MRWFGYAIAVAAMAAASLLVMPIYISSFEPSTPFDLVVWVWLSYCIGGVFVGISLPRQWYLATAIAWYPLIFGIAAPIRICTQPEPFEYYCAISIKPGVGEPSIGSPIELSGVSDPEDMRQSEQTTTETLVV